MPLIVMRRGVSGLLSVDGQPEAADVDAVSAVDTGCAVAVPPVLSQKDDVATATATSTAPVRLTGSSRVVASGCSEGRRYARGSGREAKPGSSPTCRDQVGPDGCARPRVDTCPSLWARRPRTRCAPLPAGLVDD